MSKEAKHSNKTVWIVLAIIAGLLLIITVLGIIGGYLFFKSIGIDTVPINTNTASNSLYDHPYLSADQEQSLANIGIDPASLPTDVTQEQIDCAYDAVGQERANEILNGSEPTLTEIVKVMPCLNL